MNTYNLIDKPWLLVKESGGEANKVGLKYLFANIKSIDSLVTPEFHRTKAYLYDPAVMHFLSVIVLAANYKKGNDRACGDGFVEESLCDGLDTDVVLKYLDKYRDRFDLFDENRPFLQNPALKELLKEDASTRYELLFNPLTPSGNNKMFGRTREMSSLNCKMTCEELAYVLLYTASEGVSPMSAKYSNKSLCAKLTMQVMPVGENLEETILMNCPDLSENLYADGETRVRSFFDRPFWEMDAYAIPSDVNYSELEGYVLFNSFLPLIPVLAAEPNSEGVVERLALSRSLDCSLLKKDAREELTEAYLVHNPWAVKTSSESKEEESDIGYHTYTPSHNAWGLSIAATKEGAECVIVGNRKRELKDNPVKIYYRYMDGKKTNVLGAGYLSVPSNVFNHLCDKEKHKAAQRYQDDFKKAKDILIDSLRVAGTKQERRQTYSDRFSYFIENDFFNVFISNIDALDPERSVLEALMRMRDMVLLLVDESSREVKDISKFIEGSRKAAASFGSLIRKEKRK